MIRDSVENTDAFVEKYIFEYRGFLFRIHTWRQIEILTVWFAGILAALGASVLYFSSGFSESVVHGHAPDGRAVQDPRPENVYDGLSGKYLYGPAAKTGDKGAGDHRRDRRRELIKKFQGG